MRKMRSVFIQPSVIIAIATALAITSFARGQTTCGGATGPDVIVGVITGPAPYTASGTLEALSLGTTSCNMGTSNLMWNQCPANTHPVIGGNLYRYNTVNGSGRFEQVGQSWLKHAFTALTNNDCCTCNGVGGNQLGVGCSDPYTASRNGTQSGLGPKYAVNAHTGGYPTGCPTHPSGGNTGRLEVEIADLVATNGGSGATTRYFGQSQYVTPDDSSNHNQNNNCSYIEVTVSGSGTAWNFGFLGSTVRQIPAINVWKIIDPAVTQTDLNVPEDDGFPARVTLSAKATSLGGGIYHYEYAVSNMNSDRSMQSFSIPVSASVSVTNIGFRDVVYRGGDGVNAAGTGGTNYDGTDWPATVSGGAITWATQTYAVHRGANAIRWGTLYNFRFDANIAPTTGNATLVQFKPGAQTVTASTVIPTAAACNPPVVDPIHNGVSTCGVSFASGVPTLNSGTTPVTWSLGAGSPAGMTINPITGVVSWPMPVMTGTPYTITTIATNSCGNGSQNWSLNVNPNTPAINSIPGAFAVCGAAYTSPAPTATGGSAPLSWSLVSGPAGMTINSSTGAVSWPSPTATGSPFTVSVKASSANNCGSSSPMNWQLGVVVGDFDANGLVTDADIAGFVDDLLLDAATCAGDLNGDGFVDGNDIAVFDAALGV